MLPARQTEHKLNSSVIIMRKNSTQQDKNNKNCSTVILETADKKLTFNLKNDTQFLSRNNIDNNLSKVRKSFQVSNDPKEELQKSMELEGLILDNVKEKESSNVSNVCFSNKPNKPYKIETGRQNDEVVALPIKVESHRLGDLSTIKKDEENGNVDQSLNGIITEGKMNIHDQLVLGEKDLSTLDKNEKNNMITIQENILGNLNLVSAFENRMDQQTIDPSSIVRPEDNQYHQSNQYSKSNQYNQSNQDELPMRLKTLNFEPNRNRNFHKLITQQPKTLTIEKGSSKINFLNNNMNFETVNSNPSEASDFPFRICFICDQFFIKEKTFSSGDCEHTFCKRCGKAFYEEKVEQGDVLIKCPVYKCKKLISQDVIRNLISEKHFKVIEGISSISGNNLEILNENMKSSSISKLNKVNTMSNLNNNKDNNMHINIPNKKNNYTSATKMDSIKFYSQKHVLDINTNESFFIFNKAKEQFCIKCSEPALYGKTGKYVVKCLNCYHSICKFCMKTFTSDHFEISSFNYCKVYFRRRLRKVTAKSKTGCKNFCFYLLVFLASYLLICLATYKWVMVNLAKVFCMNSIDDSKSNLISNNDNCGCENDNCFKCFFFYFTLVLTYMLITPILLMIIPYYPPFYIMLP